MIVAETNLGLAFKFRQTLPKAVIVLGDTGNKPWYGGGWISGPARCEPVSAQWVRGRQGEIIRRISVCIMYNTVLCIIHCIIQLYYLDELYS